MIAINRVMSFNINGDQGESPNAWRERSDLVFGTIERWSPDLVGLQEVSDDNLPVLERRLHEFAHVPGNRYGDVPPDGRTPIFWRASRFELADAGEIWFSETPDIESAGFGVPYPMGATWVCLRNHGTGEELIHVNTHYEDGVEGERSRREATRVIVDLLQRLGPEKPTVLTGDFNTNPWSQPYLTFLNSGFVDAYRAAGNADSAHASTFHGFQGDAYFALNWGGQMSWRVDWILARAGSRPFTTLSAEIVRDAQPPTFPSDHYPVVAELALL